MISPYQFQLLQLIRWALTQKFVSKKIAQRIAGKINHIARRVHAARLFIARVLLSLQEAHTTGEVSVDLHWFALFVKRYNGRSLMNLAAPTKVLKADSCLSGGRGTDIKRCCELVYSPRFAEAHHISTLEAINCLVAVWTSVSAKDRDFTIVVQCDSDSAMHALAFGRTRVPVLMAVCRAVWYLVAILDIKYPGYHHTI